MLTSYRHTVSSEKGLGDIVSDDLQRRALLQRPLPTNAIVKPTVGPLSPELIAMRRSSGESRRECAQI